MDDEQYLDADGDPIIFPPGTPDEIKQRAAAAAARQAGIRADLELRMNAIFTQLDDEMLVNLRIAFGQVAGAGANAGSMARYYEGLCVGSLAMRGRFGITMEPSLIGKEAVPGIEGLSESLGAPPAAPSSRPAAPSTSPPGAVHPDLLALGGDVADDGTASIEVPFDQFTPERACGIYNVKPVDPTALFDPEKSKVVCNGCGLEYVSLADRMLRPPDGCHGCHEKARWG